MGPGFSSTSPAMVTRVAFQDEHRLVWHGSLLCRYLGALPVGVTTLAVGGAHSDRAEYGTDGGEPENDTSSKTRAEKRQLPSRDPSASPLPHA